MNTVTDRVQEGLQYLLDRYGVEPPFEYRLNDEGIFNKEKGFQLTMGFHFLKKEIESWQVPLLTWRMRRKFVEIKKVIESRTIEDPCLFRFSVISPKADCALEALLYEELDLAEYLLNRKIVEVRSVQSNNRLAINLVLTTADGMLGSIEIASNPSSGREKIERHEIIGRRGTVSDSVVDTLIPSQSVYLFNDRENQTFLDTDMELFDASPDEIEMIRSVFEVFKAPEIIADLQEQHKHLFELIKKIL